MLYKKAVDKDIYYFIKFRKILLGHEDDNSLDDTFFNYFLHALNDKSLVAWIAEDDNAIISTVCLSICQLVPRFDNPSGKIAYLSNVFTTPDYRRQGIASNLIREAVNDVLSQGIKKVLLHSTDMVKSIYENIGFVEGKNYFVLKAP